MPYMKARHLLLPLTILLALMAFASWQLLAPEPARAPGRLHANAPIAATPNPAPEPGVHPLPPESAPDPAAWNLGENVAAPALVNDPNLGQVWLRVIDDETGRPLVLTRCDLWGVYAGESGARFESRIEGDAYQPNRRTFPIRTTPTDEFGCLKLSATPTGIDPARLTDTATEPLRKEGTRKLLSGFDVDFPGDEVGFLYPVPENCEPVTRPQDLATRISELRKTPKLEPFDVRVRRCPVISGRVTDPDGQPMADATVFAFPVDIAPESRTWAEFQNFTYLGLRELIELGEHPVRAHELIVDGLARQISAGARDASTTPHEPQFFEVGATHARLENCDTRTNAQGMFRLPTLCRGEWFVAAYRHDAEMRHAAIAMPADVTHDFVLFPGALGRLEVIVHHRQATTAEPVETELELWCVGPTGARLPLYDATKWFFDHHNSDSSTSIYSLERVPAGPLRLRVQVHGFKDLWASASTTLAKGQTTRIELTPGEAKTGRLRAKVSFDGKLLPQVTFSLLFLEDGTLEHHTCYGDSDEVLDLPAGRYRACFQGLAPQEFELLPGGLHTLQAELVSASVAFSIGAELHAVMMPQLEEEQNVWLEIEATGEWTGANHLTALDQRMRDVDPEYDRMIPGATHTWKLPPGDYIYALHNNYGQSIEGPLHVKPGAQSIHFSLQDLPGLGAVRVDLSGFDEDHDPSLEWHGLDDATFWAQSPGESSTGPSISYPDDDHVGPNWFHEVTELRRDKNTAWLITGRGRRLSVTCTWAAKEFGSHLTRAANVPGSLQFRPADADGWGNLQISRAEDDTAGYEIHAVNADHPPRHLDIGDCRLPHGPWRIIILREYTPEGGEYPTITHALVDITISASDATLSLSQIVFHVGGTLALSLQGRGTLEAGRDPWWEADNDDLEFRTPVLLRLDGAQTGASPAIKLGPPSRVDFGTPPSLGYAPLQLAPGRYRLLPWFDAPANLAREFDIKPGQSTTVILQGG